VEDEIWIRIDLAQRLRAAGFAVFTAVDGDEALMLLRGSVHVNLLLTDLQMPRMDGTALVEQIRAHFPHMRIFVTSTQLPQERVYRMVDGFFPKPLDVLGFARHIKTCSTPS
jgi:CheY-like chemotaxis protein